MTEQQTATSPEASEMGLISRFFAAFTSPGHLFQSLVRRPVWFWMAMLTGVLGAVLNYVIFNTEAGANAYRRQLAEAGQELPPEAMEQALTVVRIGAPIGAVIVTPIFCLILAGIAYLIFNVVKGGEGTFRQALAVAAHVFPIGLLQGILRTVLILQKESFQATTSLAAFAPFLEPDSSILLFLKGLDPFYLWQTGLLALGMSVIHKFPLRKCAMILFTIYGVVLLAVVLIHRLVG